MIRLETLRTLTDSNKGYLIGLLSAVFFSTSAIFIRFLTLETGMPALVLAYWREVVVVVVLFFYLVFFRRQWLAGIGPHIPFLASFGCIIAIHNAVWTLSLTINGASVATALAYVSPAFTVVLSYFLLHEALTATKVTAVVMCVLGSSLLMDMLNPQSWELNTPGILAGLFTGLLHAFYTLMARKASQKGVNPWTTLFVSFGFASIIMLAMNLAIGRVLPGGASSAKDMLWLGRDWAAWAMLVILIGLPTVVGWGSYNVSLKLLPGSIANLIITVEPVITAVVAYFFLYEVLTGIQVLGSLLILTGVIIMRLRSSELPE
jgi:drug/metabolite transporter (DMT)-like permease